MKPLLYAGIGLVFGLLVSADPEPIAPAKPVQILTEVGSVAAATDKATVHTLGTISRAGRDFQVLVQDKGMMGAKCGVALADVPGIAEALIAAGQALARGDAYPERKVGQAMVSIDSLGTEQYVKLRVETERFTFNSSSVYFDADNAANLARLLERGAGIASWLDGRTGEIRFE